MEEDVRIPALAEYQADHLLLLVGSNPLPNYVAGRLLRGKAGTVHLLHTRDTAGIAGSLRQELGEPCELTVIDRSDPVRIRSEVTRLVRSLRGGRIGLHYTGGTKAMSVHAYEAVRSAGQDADARPVCSYLDARTLQLLIDPVDSSQEGRGYPVPLRVTLDQVIRLHGWELRSALKRTALWPSVAHELTALYEDPMCASSWKDWYCNSFVETCARRDGESIVHKRGRPWFKTSTMLEGSAVPWPSDPCLQPVVAALQGELGSDATPDGLLASEASRRYFGGDVGELAKWLEGTWLEVSVLMALDRIAGESRLHDRAMGLNLRVRDGSAEPEFDVGAMRGHQLYAFSCSTGSDKPQLKLKLFEAVTRARQFGGAEACVALVCCSDKPEQLEDEMRADFGAGRRIRVFGRRHLGNLAEEIGSWIETATGDDGVVRDE